MKASILGYEDDCNCDHCGRKLKIGIKISGYGVIGADCLNKAIIFNKKRWGGGKPGAAHLRELAIKRQRCSDDRLKDNGYFWAMSIEVNEDKLNFD